MIIININYYNSFKSLMFQQKVTSYQLYFDPQNILKDNTKVKKMRINISYLMYANIYYIYYIINHKSSIRIHVYYNYNDAKYNNKLLKIIFLL